MLTAGETNRSDTTLHALQLGQCLVLPHFLRHSSGLDQLSKRINHDIPQLLMLLVQKDHESGGLRVERAGNVRDCRIDEILDLRIRDRARLAKLVNGTAVLGELDEGVDERHFGNCGCEFPSSWC